MGPNSNRWPRSASSAARSAPWWIAALAAAFAAPGHAGERGLLADGAPAPTWSANANAHGSADVPACVDTDCKGGRVCVNGTCQPPELIVCQSDIDCPGEMVCEATKCAAPRTHRASSISRGPSASSEAAAQPATPPTSDPGAVSIDVQFGFAYQAASGTINDSDSGLAGGWNVSVPFSAKRPASIDLVAFWDQVTSFRGDGSISKNILGVEVRTVGDTATLAGGAGLLIGMGWPIAAGGFTVKPGFGLIGELRLRPSAQSRFAIPIRASLGVAPAGDISWVLFSLTSGISFNL